MASDFKITPSARIFSPLALSVEPVEVMSTIKSHFAVDINDRESCMKAFDQHNEHVKRTAPAERLVVWQAGDGWEPLLRRACEKLSRLKFDPVVRKHVAFKEAKIK